MRWLVVVALVAGCAQTRYVPRVVARGELTLRYHHAYEMWAEGQRVSRGVSWNGLEGYVGCVEQAREHAAEAHDDGRAVLPLSIAGGTLGVLALGGLVGFADRDHEWDWLSAGLAAAGAGVALAAVGRLMRNQANGHAIDAMNFYNDSVGSLGATCGDLTYPAPAGPATSTAAPIPTTR